MAVLMPPGKQLAGYWSICVCWQVPQLPLEELWLDGVPVGGNRNTCSHTHHLSHGLSMPAVRVPSCSLSGLFL